MGDTTIAILGIILVFSVISGVLFAEIRSMKKDFIKLVEHTLKVSETGLELMGLQERNHDLNLEAFEAIQKVLQDMAKERESP